MKDKILYFFKFPLQLPVVLITKLPYFRFIYETQDYQCLINFETWFSQKILNRGGNRNAYWPVHYTSTIYDADKIYAGVDTCPGLSRGCYIQGKGTIYIGDYTQIGPQVVIVSANHDPYDSRKHLPEPVRIGKYCWLGAGCKIMPGVELGDWTIVAAGAVVTKSFAEGHCVIAGVPAKLIRSLDKEKCIPFTNKIEYCGYIRKDRFEEFRKRKLKI